MHSAAKENERCPVCDTGLRSMRCDPCNGTGRWLLFRCTSCRGSGKMRGCPHSFAHPGVGPQGSLAQAYGPVFLHAETC